MTAQPNRKLLGVLGFAAVAVYIFTVILGGFLFPGYSHIAKDVSQLTATGSTTAAMLNPLFLVYNLLIVAFGVLYFRLGHGRLPRTIAGMITLIGVLGALTWIFPIDLRGHPITTTGKMHIIIVSIVSLLTVVAASLAAVCYRKIAALRALAYISLTAAIVFLIAGPVAALGVESSIAGALERIPIGTFLIWFAAMGYYLSKDYE